MRTFGGTCKSNFDIIFELIWMDQVYWESLQKIMILTYLKIRIEFKIGVLLLFHYTVLNLQS